MTPMNLEKEQESEADKILFALVALESPSVIGDKMIRRALDDSQRRERGRLIQNVLNDSLTRPRDAPMAWCKLLQYCVFQLNESTICENVAGGFCTIYDDKDCHIIIDNNDEKRRADWLIEVQFWAIGSGKKPMVRVKQSRKQFGGFGVSDGLVQFFETLGFVTSRSNGQG